MTVQKTFRRAIQAAAAAAFLATTMLSGLAHAGPTLDKINQRGTIKVGVGTTPGFFAPDGNGKWQGFFVDFGRALSIAVFGDPDKVEFTNSSPQQRLPALQSGEFDILLSGVTVTTTRAFKLGFHFGPTVFYDGQGILVRKDLGVTKAADLDGATIGAHSVLVNARIGRGANIKPFCHIEDAVVGAESQIGPYARLRPGTELGEDVHIGNFVEVKNSQVAAHSKANHLAYVGDATVGSRAPRTVRM